MSYSGFLLSVVECWEVCDRVFSVCRYVFFYITDIIEEVGIDFWFYSWFRS